MMDIREFVKENEIDFVYWVDDVHADMNEMGTDALFDIVVTAAENASEGAVNSLKQWFKGSVFEANVRLGRNFTKGLVAGDVEDVKQEVADYLGEKTRKVLLDSIECLEGGLTEEISKAMDDYFSGGCEYRKLSFSEWNRHEGELRRDERKVLMILDLINLVETDVPREAGKDVISKCKDRDNMLIVVLSNDCSVREEVKFAQELVKGCDLKAEITVYVLSKQRDVADGMHKHLGDVLHRISLMKAYVSLMNWITVSYKKAVSDTLDKLKYLTIEEIIYKISYPSQEEGTPEYESILRLIGSLSDNEFQGSLVDNEDLMESVKNCRSLTRRLDRSSEVEQGELESILKVENFDNIKAVNKTKAAVSIGDVFSLYDKKENLLGIYILLGNPCFSTLRHKGERKDQNALLLPIVPEEPSHDAFCSLGKVYHENTLIKNDRFSGRVYVDFSLPEAVSYDVLDLVWTNEYGVAEFDMSDGSVRELINENLLIKAQIKRVEAMRDLSREGELKVIEGVVYQRVARVSPYFASIIINQYASCLNKLPSPTRLG